MKWIQAISTAFTPQPDHVPEGWKTISQISEEIGRSYSRTSQIVNTMIAKGLVDTKKFLITKNHGRTYIVPHYKLKDSGKSKGA